MDKYTKVREILSKIVAEIQRLGRWNHGQLDERKMVNMGPFGMNTMSLEEWIQFFLVPRVEQILKECGDFPQSTIAPYAVKYFDGDPDGQHLLEMIVEFDRAVNE